MEALEEEWLPFRRRVQEFWRLFAQSEYELRYLLEHQREEAYRAARELLQLLFAAPVFDLWQQDGRYWLTVSPECDGGRLYALMYWQSQADQWLQADWEFEIGRTPVEQADQLEVVAEGLVISPRNIQVWPALLEDGRLGLACFSAELAAMEPGDAYMLFCDLLEQCIGELCLMTNIEAIELLEEPEQDVEPMWLAQLAPYIDQLQMEGQLPPENDPLGLYTGYDLRPREGPWALRDDIFTGHTSAAALPMLNSYYLGESQLFASAARDGLVWGFLFFDVTAIEPEQRVNVRTALEEELGQLMLEQGLGECVGGASGYQYAYLDIICYDWEAFLQAAHTLVTGYRELYQLKSLGFAELCRDGQVWFLQEETCQMGKNSL